ncbi:MAG: helix-turn-helix domain-containing protein [Nitrospirota bacterium]
MGKGLKEQVAKLERRLILNALEAADWKQSLAAKELWISERVLRYKMRKYGLKLETKLSLSDRIVDATVPLRKTES